MKTNTARFITTSTDLLSKLQQLNLNKQFIRITINSDGHGISFEGNPDIYWNVHTCYGNGDFVYGVESITGLIDCLKTLSERPVTIKLDDYIWLEQVMF